MFQSSNVPKFQSSKVPKFLTVDNVSHKITDILPRNFVFLLPDFQQDYKHEQKMSKEFETNFYAM